jgi:hypothetical protein
VTPTKESRKPISNTGHLLDFPVADILYSTTSHQILYITTTGAGTCRKGKCGTLRQSSSLRELECESSQRPRTAGSTRGTLAPPPHKSCCYVVKNKKTCTQRCDITTTEPVDVGETLGCGAEVRVLVWRVVEHIGGKLRQAQVSQLYGHPAHTLPALRALAPVAPALHIISYYIIILSQQHQSRRCDTYLRALYHRPLA